MLLRFDNPFLTSLLLSGKKSWQEGQKQEAKKAYARTVTAERPALTASATHIEVKLNETSLHGDSEGPVQGAPLTVLPRG